MNGATATQDADFNVGTLTVGSGYGAGTYDLNSGALAAGDVTVNGNGELDVTNPGDITITEDLTFANGAVYTAAAVTTITMDSASFYNNSTSESDMAGLKNTEFIFKGGVADTFELAGLDDGPAVVDYNGNFYLHSLEVGTNAETEFLTLVDNTDNGNRGGRWGNAEALYVDWLIMGSGSTLDLNNLHVYYRHLTDNGGTYLNGTPQAQIPEPSSIILLVGGGLAAAAGILRKRVVAKK